MLPFIFSPVQSNRATRFYSTKIQYFHDEYTFLSSKKGISKIYCSPSIIDMTYVSRKKEHLRDELQDKITLIF